MNVLHILGQFFCKHEYEKINYVEVMECGLRYPLRVYKCTKCEKEIIVDGRKDRYAR